MDEIYYFTADQDYPNLSDLSSPRSTSVHATEADISVSNFSLISKPETPEQSHPSHPSRSKPSSNPGDSESVRARGSLHAGRVYETHPQDLSPPPAPIPRFHHLRVPFSDLSLDPEPQVPHFAIDQFRAALNHLQRKSARLQEMYVEKRRNHLKFRDEAPSVLTGFTMGQSFDAESMEVAEARGCVAVVLERARKSVFECRDFADISTSSLRHTCMGCLADSYRLHMKFTEDIDKFAGQLFAPHRFDSVLGEKLAFLKEVEARGNLKEVCQYSVVTKTSSAAKGVVRTMYLELLALQHNTSPTLAQELVPGFTYDHIQSLDEVVELVERQSDPQQSDSEIERFRQRISNQRPLGPRLKPAISPDFVERLNRMMKSR